MGAELETRPLKARWVSIAAAVASAAVLPLGVLPLLRARSLRLWQDPDGGGVWLAACTGIASVDAVDHLANVDHLHELAVVRILIPVRELAERCACRSRRR